MLFQIGDVSPGKHQPDNHAHAPPSNHQQQQQHEQQPPPDNNQRVLQQYEARRQQLVAKQQELVAKEQKSVARQSRRDAAEDEYSYSLEPVKEFNVKRQCSDTSDVVEVVMATTDAVANNVSMETATKATGTSKKSVAARAKKLRKKKAMATSETNVIKVTKTVNRTVETRVATEDHVTRTTQDVNLTYVDGRLVSAGDGEEHGTLGNETLGVSDEKHVIGDQGAETRLRSDAGDQAEAMETQVEASRQQAEELHFDTEGDREVKRQEVRRLKTDAELQSDAQNDVTAHNTTQQTRHEVTQATYDVTRQTTRDVTQNTVRNVTTVTRDVNIEPGPGNNSTVDGLVAEFMGRDAGKTPLDHVTESDVTDISRGVLDTAASEELIAKHQVSECAGVTAQTQMHKMSHKFRAFSSVPEKDQKETERLSRRTVVRSPLMI